MSHRAAWAIPFLILGLMGASQDPKPGKFGRRPKVEDEEKGSERPLKYAGHYGRALEYIKQHYTGRGDWRKVPALYSGLVFLVDGSPDLKDHRDKALDIAKGALKGTKHPNGNWFMAYAAMLAAIAHLREPDEELKKVLEESVAVVEGTREPGSGGWCHSLGFDRKNGYSRKGGGEDIALLTGTILSAYLIAREGGVEVPDAFIDRTVRNLEGLARKGVLPYGSKRPWFGKSMNRNAAPYYGMNIAGLTEPEFFKTTAKKLPEAVKLTEKAHAYGPGNFLACALAMQAMGRYEEYAAYWLPKLAERQKGDGSIMLLSDRAKSDPMEPKHPTPSTAVFALMILMQKHDVVPPTKKAGGKKAGGNKSPFGR